MQIKTKVKTKIDTNKVKQRVKKTTEMSVAGATAYLWKTIRSSIKKRTGRAKKIKRYIERAYFYQNGEHKEIDLSSKKIIPSEYYNQVASNQKNRVVKWRQGGKRENRGVVRDVPEDFGAYSVRKGSLPGLPPYTWKIDRTTYGGRNSTFPDYWLKESILFDPKKGLVYSNPKYGKKVLYLPQVLETGTNPYSYQKNYFSGYAVWLRTFKNHQTHIYFTERWRKGEKKKADGGKRPYMSYGLKQAVEKGRLSSIFATNARIQFH
jgi:hypothetical protein